MLKIALKGILANKIRLALTGLAIVLGVGFLSGSLVLTDTVITSFDGLFADINAGKDAEVRGKTELESDFGTVRTPIPQDLVAEIQSLDGVKAVEGYVIGFALIVDKDGEPVGGGQGPPTFGYNWGVVDELNPYEIAEGRPPSGPGEVAIDKRSAQEGNLALGDTTTVIARSGAEEVEIVGITTFGGNESALGASAAHFVTSEAQRVLAKGDAFDEIAVVADGLSQQELVDVLADALPDDIEVVTGETATEEDQTDIQENLTFFNAIFTGFAAVALFVGSFVIYNTFSIIVAQRSRETALLRAVGASRRQVLGSILLESLIAGVVLSAVGVLAGLGIAAGLKALFAAVGFDLPAQGLVFKNRTVVVGMTAGVVVSVLASIIPAVRASRVPPLAAMRDTAIDRSGTSVKRLIAGGLVTGIGLVIIGMGLFGGADASILPLGAIAVFVGVAVLGPAFARPAAGAIGSWMPRLAGTPGRLARENAMRNPSRTSSTAAALMIGVGVVALIGVLAESTKASVDDLLDESFGADLVIDSGSFGSFGGLPSELADRVAELPGVEFSSGAQFAVAKVDDDAEEILGLAPQGYETIFDIGIVEGSAQDLAGDSIGVLDERAERDGLSIGDTVEMFFPDTGIQRLRVAAIFDGKALTAPAEYVLADETVRKNLPEQLDFSVYVTYADGVDIAEARQSIETIAADYANAKVRSQAEFKENFAQQINQFLVFFGILLVLSLIIALIGIANTLALSVFERTNELGLLRAVGMTRRQTKRMVRLEAVITSLLGTFQGLLVGSLFGYLLVRSLEDFGLTTFALPVGQLITVTILAAIAGIVAAIFPARRAARTDILAAISHQ